MISLRFLIWLFGTAVVVVPVAAVVLFVMAVVGSPGACPTDGRVIEPSLDAAASFQQKWDEMNATLNAGQVSSATFTETEATSRARLWVEEHDVPVEDLLVCFNMDGGSASGRIDVPFFPGDIDAVVHGTLVLTGDEPEVRITDIEVGNLPGPVAGLTESIVDGLIAGEAGKVPLRHDYGLAFRDGEVVISGQP